MKRENRKPTRAEWDRITSRRPVVRRIPNRTPKPESDEEKLEKIAGEVLNARLEDEDQYFPWERPGVGGWERAEHRAVPYTRKLQEG